MNTRAFCAIAGSDRNAHSAAPSAVDQIFSFFMLFPLIFCTAGLTDRGNAKTPFAIRHICERDADGSMFQDGLLGGVKGLITCYKNPHTNDAQTVPVAGCPVKQV